MTTALERLRQISGLSSGGTGAALRSLAGAAGVAGALLAGWSVLPSGTATQHLLSDGVPAIQPPAPFQYGGGGRSRSHSGVQPQHQRASRTRAVRDADLLLMHHL